MEFQAVWSNRKGWWGYPSKINIQQNFIKYNLLVLLFRIQLVDYIDDTGTHKVRGKVKTELK